MNKKTIKIINEHIEILKRSLKTVGGTPHLDG